MKIYDTFFAVSSGLYGDIPSVFGEGGLFNGDGFRPLGDGLRPLT